jgi:O-antigen ligase
MKWAGLLILVAAILPLANWLKRNPDQAPKLWILVGFLPFGITPFHLYIAFVSWPAWPGYVKGLEFSVLDAVAIALYLSLPRSRGPLPFRISIAFYFVAAVFSVFQATVPMAAVFYLWQLARMFLLYAVVVKACADRRVIPALLTGMALGILMETVLTIWERFVLGVLQAAGSFGHQNFLGVVSHFVIFPFFALLLAGRPGRFPIIISLAGAIIAVLTTSRATVGLDVFGYTLVFILSAWRRWTPRKALVAAISVMAAAVLAPVAVSSFDTRFAGDQIDNYDERAALEKVAAMILDDHPMGIGANSYVTVANMGGYNQRAGVAWTSGSAFVHNAYWLVADESGYFGLFAFLILLLRPLIVAFRCGWRYRLDDRGDLLLGFGVALLTVYIHSLFEWIFMMFQAQYMFALTAGAVAGLSQQLGYWRRTPGLGAPIAATPMPMQITKGKVPSLTP